jgi:lipopolysaccharide export system protein LptA
LGQQLDRCRPDRGDIVERSRYGQMQDQTVVVVGQVGVGLTQGRRRLIAEPVVVKDADAQIEAKIAEPGAIFRTAAHIAEGAAGKFAVQALEGQAVPHRQPPPRPSY